MFSTTNWKNHLNSILMCHIVCVLTKSVEKLLNWKNHLNSILMCHIVCVLTKSVEKLLNYKLVAGRSLCEV